MSGVYISVKNSMGGTIYAANDLSDWDTRSSSPSGYGGFSSGTTKFTAEPDYGYAFSHFEVYIDSAHESYSSSYGIKDRDYTSNPLSLSNAYGGSNGSYLVRAVFEETLTTCDVYIRSYKDGVYYASGTITVDAGEIVKLNNEVTTPSGYVLDYVLVNGVKYNSLAPISVDVDTTVEVYFKTEKTRPTNWSWYNTVSAGSAIKLSASEWNSFTARINAFRAYVGLSNYSFTTASSGMEISASICNEAWTAVYSLLGYQSTYSVMPSKISSSSSLPAAFFNGLKNIINAIP